MRSLGYSFKKLKGELGKEWPGSSDTDTPRTVPTEERVDIERCGHHRSQRHHQHRRDVLQDVASARIRVAHFSRQDFRRGTREPLPIAADHLSFGEPLDDGDDPHSFPHMAGHHCHEPRWHQSPMDLLHGRVYHAHQSRVPGPLHVETRAHVRLVFVPPNTTAVRQPLDRAHMRPFKAALGLGALRWSGNPTPSRRCCQHHSKECWTAQPPHALDPPRSEGDRHDASHHSSLVRHRLPRCRAG